MTDVLASEGVPKAGLVVSVIVSLVAVSVMSSFLMVIGIYLDSYFFVFGTAILKYGLTLKSGNTCQGAIYLCLVAYITSKLIYVFLVEKAYIIRGALVPRTSSKLWCFNIFGMLGGYAVVIVLNFVYRISYLNEDGQCVIGMERRALLPLIIFDLVLNVYLTSLFLIPLCSLYSFQDKQWTRPATKLHKMAVRTFIGSLATLTSAIVNLSVLTALNGEPGWVCLLCCNIDVVWSATMIYWVTYHDHIGSHSHNGSPDDGSRSTTNSSPYLTTTTAANAARKFSRQHHHHHHHYNYRHHHHQTSVDTTTGDVADLAEPQTHHEHSSKLFDVEQGRGRGRGRQMQHEHYPPQGAKRNIQFAEVVTTPESARLKMWPSLGSPAFITSPEWVDADDDDDDDETATGSTAAHDYFRHGSNV